MSCCNINYSRNYETVVTSAFKSSFASAQKSSVSRENTPSTTGWFPIIARYSPRGNAFYTPQLSMPQITGYTLFDPINCNNADFTDRELSDPNSINMDTSYCEQWSPENNASIQTGRMKKADGTQAPVSRKGGLSDVMTHQSDIYHGIPYLMTQYASGFMDNKFDGTFPLTMNNPVGWNSVVESTPEEGTNKRYSDWHIMPRMGEIDYDPMTSQYLNERDHSMANKKAMIAHKTAGNFILFNIGDVFQENDEDWEDDYLAYADILEPLLVDTSQGEKINERGSWDLKLPEPEEFMQPYGFDAFTYNNVFVGDKKRVSYWKWDINKCSAAWVLKTDEEIKIEVGEESDKMDYITYIPSGDCFIAKIDPIEPQNKSSDPQMNKEGEKRCPSGVKFIDEGTVYTIPHNSYAVYISCNIYPAFYEAFNALKKITKSIENLMPVEPDEEGDSKNTLYRVIEQAMYVATHPLVDKITVDLHKNNIQSAEKLTPHIWGGYLNPQYSYMNAYDKNYASFNNLNLCKTWTDLGRTINNKYGSYFTEEIEIGSESFAPYTSSHIGVDVLYDLYAKGGSFRTKGRQSTDYKDMTPWYPDFQVSLGGLKLKVADERSIIERTYYSFNEDEEGCSLDDWKAFSNLQLNDKTLYSRYLQSGLYEMNSYYVRNVNEQGGSIRGYCDICDEYSTYENYGGEENCVEHDGSLPFCDCDENPDPEKYPELPCVGISDNTVRLERKYEVIVDTNSFPINMAFHLDGGAYYRARNLEETGFIQNANIQAWGSMKVRFASFDTRVAQTRAWAVDVYQLQTDDPKTFSCERFPVLENCEQSKILYDDTYPIQKDTLVYAHTTAYTPAQSTKYSPSLKLYGGYDKGKLEELFPAYDFPDVGKTVRGKTTYRIDPDNPFGCESNDYLVHENYLRSSIKIELNNQNDPYCDLVMTSRETVDITGPRYFITFDEFGNEEQILNKDFKRFSTSVTYQPQEPEPTQGSPSVKSNSVVWPGGGKFLVPQQDQSKDNWFLTFENSFLMELMSSAGALSPEDEDSGISANIFPGIENPQHQFENIYFDDISYTLCNNKELWFDFGDQTSSVRLTFIKRPRPVKAKFALFAPNLVELGENVKFDFNQIKTDDENMATVMPSYFRNQLNSDQMPKYTFNNDISSESELPEAASWIISSEQAKTLAPLFKTVSSFDSNRKIRIIFKQDKTYWELKTLPTKYYSHGKSWQGYPHFVKPVFQGIDTNYIPGMVPYVQRTSTPEESRWIVKPNTEYASDKAGLVMGEDETAFDPQWPLNLQLNNYAVNLDKNTVVFPGARMFFAMFPEIDTWDGAADNAPAGSLVKIGNFIYYKIQGGSPSGDERFQDYYLIFNPLDTYTWQKYSDLHIDFANTSYAGYVYNGSFDLPNIPFYFYRYPFGDRSKIKKALATKISIRSTLQDSSGRRIFPATLIDGCVDYCQEGGVSYLKIETEIKFATKLNKDWLEINSKKTPISSYHIYHPECVGAEKDRLLANEKYATKWADLEHFDDIIFDHWIANEVGESYYPQSRYLNTFYKTIVDNGNYINTQKNSVLPQAGPFRFMVHQKYSVDYNAGEPVAARRISGVHNYLPFMDINDKSAVQSANYLITEPTDNFDGLLKPVAEDENGVVRPDLEFVLTVPVECELERVWLPAKNKAMLSESLRMDTPQYWIENIQQEEEDRCDGESLSQIFPRPIKGKNYGSSFGGAVRGITASTIADDDKFPTATWTPEAYAIWTQYCDFDPKGCDPVGTPYRSGIKPCYMNQGGSTSLKAEYKFANPNTIPFANVATSIDGVYITYDAGIINGMNGYRPPMILRSISEPTYNKQSKNNIQYSQDYPDSCNDSVVLPPLYQYPEWDDEVSDTFMAGADKWRKAALENDRAKNVFYADVYAEEMTFRALYGEVEFVNRQSINGTKKLTANEIINYVDPEITVSEMHDQILWDYDSAGDRIQKPKVEGFFTVKSPMEDGESVSVVVNGETISAYITAADGGSYVGSTMNISFKDETYSFPIRMVSAKYATMISVESDSEPPEVAEDETLELVQKGRVVHPYESYTSLSCQSAVAGCPVSYPPSYNDISDDDWGPGETRTYVQSTSEVDMGDWYSMITLVPTADVYRWYDTYDVCESTPEFYGPYSRRCKPYEYGYCNFDNTECPPCVPSRGNETQFLEGNAKKSYYTNKNVWVNNFIASDNEQYDYEWRYCRNIFKNHGYFNRDNFSYHPNDVYRTDLVLEYAGEYNAILEAYASCVGECNGDCGCYCATPKNQGIGWYPGRPNGTKEGWGWCDFERNVCPWGTYPGQTGEVPPNYYKCADCECIGDTSWLPSTADPIPDEFYAPYGDSGSCFCRGQGGGGNGGCGQNPPQACYQRYCYPATVACAEGKNASAADSGWWPSFGYDPDTGEAYTHALCYPKGYCNSAHDSWTRTGPKYEWRDGECGFPYRKRVDRYSRAGNFSYYRDRCNWGRATCMYSCVDDGNEFAPPGSSVVDHKFTTITETKEVLYDTYIRETNYGGGAGGIICNSGALFDGCPNTWFTVSYTNNKINLTFQSGIIAWIESDERPGGIDKCTGPTISAENHTICETVKYQTNANVRATFNNELGHLDNYVQTTDCNCGEDISVDVPEQTPQWATRTLEGKCYVSQWMEEHVHESVFTAGYNWTAVCQSNQSLGNSYFGFLQGYNDGDCYNNAAGSDCPVDRPWYGVAQGKLQGVDCDNTDSCSVGKRNWEQEQNRYHARKLEQYNSANDSIPEENILEGVVPGSMSELKFKTYSIEGGKAVRANQDQFGASVEDINVQVTVAYYEYKYRVRWDINDAIAQTRGDTYFVPSEGAGATEDDFQSCLAGRPFGPADTSSLEPIDEYLDMNQSESFQFSKLNYRCDGGSGFTFGRPYPNWYDFQVAPHGCLPRYGEYYGRYDSPPNNFIWTVPTISQKSCTKRRTCYYNDKLWPSDDSDYYSLSSQPTFLHCHKFLSKNWIYDYIRGSPFG